MSRMQVPTIVKHKYVKSGYPDGPWIEEPDMMQWEDEATGLPCLMHRHPGTGSWCGYVGVREGHPHYRKHYDELDLEVHGGLTYSDECNGEICHETPEPDDVWWLGFDCVHLGDFAPLHDVVYMKIGCREDYQYRDMTYVKSECEKLALQLYNLTSGSGPQTNG